MTDHPNSITFQAKDGRSLHIRPIQDGDALLLISIFEHMGSDSRYQRFHQSMDNPNRNRVQREAEQMVASVPDDSFGLITFAGDVPVGAARYIILEEEDKAEMAVSIIDEYQNSGIGSKLIALLADEGQKQGIRQLIASVQAENEAALRILEKLPFAHSQRLDDAVVEVEIDLTHRLPTS
jgi:RimJ/RimL family protein N-acetyltransferase